MWTKVKLSVALGIAKSLGYEGPDDSCSAVQKFINELTDAEITVDGKSIDVKTVYVTSDAGEDVQFVEPEGDMEDGAPEGESAKMEEDEEETEAKSAAELRRVKKELRELKMETRTPKHHKTNVAIWAADRKAPAFLASAPEIKRYNRSAEAGKTAFSDADNAREFSAWARYHLFQKRKGWSYEGAEEDREIVQKNNLVSDATAGGFSVPTQFEPDLIDLRSRRGVARQILNVLPADSNYFELPRRTGGVTIYNPAEGSSITESNPAGDNVGITAKEMAALAPVTNRLLSMSALNIADWIANEIQYGFADKEDDILFNGDGTSGFFGMTGVRTALSGLDSTVANIAGLTVASGNAYGEVTANDFLDVQGKYPDFNAPNSPVWVCSKQFFSASMQRIANAAGGNTKGDIAAGFKYEYDGTPVIISERMPRIAANSQVACLYGDFNLGVKAIEHGSMKLDMSEHVYFGSNRTAIRGIQDFGLTVHDVGNASATAADREAGPIVGLITAAS